MKKLMLAIGVVAVITISLFSFTKTKTAVSVNDPQQTYIWIKYNCGATWSATVAIFSDYNTATGPTIPTSGHFSGCLPNGFVTICAVRFLLSEIEPVPGWPGNARPKANVNPWDGLHAIAWCETGN